MLNALIVEDDADVAAVLREIIEVDPRFRVVAIADDAASSARAVEEHAIDLALVDIQLAHRSSGYAVACDLSGKGVLCLFVTGTAPPFPMPEFALGCIRKPCRFDDVAEALELIAAAKAGEPDSANRSDTRFQRY